MIKHKQTSIVNEQAENETEETKSKFFLVENRTNTSKQISKVRLK